MKENLNFKAGDINRLEDIFKLYVDARRTKGCTWTEEYPTKEIIKNGGIIVAITLTITPNKPHNLYPITIAPLTAMGPGADCATATKSNISFSSIQ